MDKSNAASNSSFKRILAAMLASLVIASSFAMLPQTYGGGGFQAAAAVEGVEEAPQEQAKYHVEQDDYNDYDYYYFLVTERSSTEDEDKGKISKFTAYKMHVELQRINSKDYKLTSVSLLTKDDIIKAGWAGNDGWPVEADFAKEVTSETTSVVIPETVEYNGDSVNVATIASGAFASASTITEVTIPSKTTVAKGLFTETSVTTLVSTVGSPAFIYACTDGESQITDFKASLSEFEGTIKAVIEKEDRDYKDLKLEDDILFKEFTSSQDTYRVKLAKGTDFKEKEESPVVIDESGDFATVTYVPFDESAKTVSIDKLGADGNWSGDESFKANKSLKITLTDNSEVNFDIVSGDFAKATVGVTKDSNAAYDAATKTFTVPYGKEYKENNLFEALGIDIVLGEGENATHVKKDNCSVKIEKVASAKDCKDYNIVLTAKSTDELYVYGEIRVTLRIEPVTVTEQNIIAENVPYNGGNPVTPKIKYVDGQTEIELKPNVDFDYEIDEDSAVGRSNITLTFKGNYKTADGEPIEASFKITPNGITEKADTKEEAAENKPYIQIEESVKGDTDKAELTYTGKEIVPSVKVWIKSGETPVELDTSYYKVTVEDATNVGENAKVVVTFQGSYSGELKQEFKITKAKWTDVKVTVDAVPYADEIDATYIKKYVHVKLNGVDLPATDFNVDSVDKDGNKITVSAAGSNLEQGTTADISYKIIQKEITADDIVLSHNYVTYTGSAITEDAVITSICGKTSGDYEKDFNVAIEKNIDVGEATITVTPKNSLHYKGTAKKTFKITPKHMSISESEATDDNVKYELTKKQTFTGGQIKPDIKLTVGSSATELAKDNYELIYSENRNVTDTAYVIIKLKGNYTGAYLVELTIDQVDLSDTPTRNKITIKNDKAAYRVGQSISPVVEFGEEKSKETLIEGKDYKVIYEENKDQPGEHKATIVFLEENFKNVTDNNKTFNYTVEEEKELSVSAPKISDSKGTELVKSELNGDYYYTVTAGETVTLEGVVEGGTGDYRYRYAAKHEGDKAYTTLATSINNGYKWTPKKTGWYVVRIRVFTSDDTTGIAMDIHLKVVSDLENNSTINGSSDEAVTVKVNQEVTINGAAQKGHVPYSYRYAAKTPAGKNIVIKDTTDQDTVTYTFTEAGVYTVYVKVTDTDGCYVVKSFTVTVEE